MRTTTTADGCRWCAQCKREKPTEAFRVLKGIRGGLDPWCIECRKAYMKAYKRL